MKTHFYKLLTVVLLAFSMTACNMMSEAESNFKINYDNYLRAQVTCVQHDKNTVSLTDSGGKPVTISHAAGNCSDITDPEHGGAYVAQLGSATIVASGQVLGAAITAYQSYQNTKNSNETRVAIAELDRQIEESRNGVIIQAIDGQAQSLTTLTEVTTTLSEQNITLGELLEALTDDGEGETESEGGEGEI
ncbi:hypothetical protein OAV22_02005 [Flavobacteriaceae bacterium]|nr:hypothetical protein [Flavobacteriaceae bacterium]